MSNDDERKLVRGATALMETAVPSCGMKVNLRPFFDLSDEAMEVRFPSSSAPEWRTYNGGLNLEGKLSK